jgi:hypothetical protein
MLAKCSLASLTNSWPAAWETAAAAVAASGGDETTLHVMRYLHSGIEADDFRRTLDRVSRAHQRFQVLGIAWHHLQREHPGAQSRQMGLEFGAEHVQQRRIGWRFVGHAESTARGVTGHGQLSYHTLPMGNANGVGSRFRATTRHTEDAFSENDSRPLPQNTTLIHLPVLSWASSPTQQRTRYS